MLEHDPHPITVEYQPEADVHTFRLGAQALPARFGIISGNIVHQLRSTLDNLVWQLVIANGKKPVPGKRGNSFPIIGELKENETFADKTQTSLARVHPDHVAVIERLQPYQNPEWGRGNHPLSILADLWNTDKHQVLKIIQATPPIKPPIELPVRFGGPSEVTVLDSSFIPPEERYPGAIIGWAYFAPPGPHPDVYMHAEFWARPTFEGGMVVFPVLTTALAIVDAVVWLFIVAIEGGEPLPNNLNLSPQTVEIFRKALTAKRTYRLTAP